MSIKIYTPEALNEIGQRTNNEDRIYPQKGLQTSDDKLFIVCDGMGGHEKGEVASEIVTQTLGSELKNHKEYVDEWQIAIAFDKAQNKIQEYIKNNPEAQGMGTTLTMLYINKKDIIVAHCGDSRIYQVRNGKIIFKTQDHSLVNELLRSGIINEQEAETHPKKNVITRAIQGSATPVKADVSVIKDIQASDYFFLCSDGILESINDQKLENLLLNKNTSEVIQELNRLCLQNSKDNYSCYLIKIAEAPASPIGNAVNSKTSSIDNSNLIQSKKNKLFLFALIGSLVLNLLLAIILIVSKPKNSSIEIDTNKSIVSEDIIAWKDIEGSNKMKDFEEYVSQYPKGFFIDNANSKIRLLKSERSEDSIWNKVIEIHNDSAYNSYLNNSPSGKHVEAAEMFVNLYKDFKEWEQVLKATTNRKSKAEAYIKNNPNGLWTSDAKKYAKSIAETIFQDNKDNEEEELKNVNPNNSDSNNNNP
jgi:PPM family protein phosphatase